MGTGLVLEGETVVEARARRAREASARYRAKYPEREQARRIARKAAGYPAEYYRANAEKMKRSAKLNAYGLTGEELDALYDRAAGYCEICSAPYDETRGPQIDHCHETGEVRGVLCHACNGGMGLLKDSASVLRRAADYLESPPGVPGR